MLELLDQFTVKSEPRKVSSRSDQLDVMVGNFMETSMIEMVTGKRQFKA